MGFAYLAKPIAFCYNKPAVYGCRESGFAGTPVFSGIVRYRHDKQEREAPPMDIRQLEILDVIVNKKSFKKAAEQCFVSTSTLTRQIAAMEAEIGFTIFERSAFGVTLTEQGEIFYQQTQSIPLLYESAVSSAREVTRKKQIVRVAIFHYTRNYIIRACEAMKAQNERLDFSFVSCRLLDSGAALLNRRADLSLLSEIEDADERFFTLPIFRCRNCVIVSEKHPLAGRESVRASELDGQTILRSSRRTAGKNDREMRKLWERCCPHSSFLDYQHPDQADALCQINAYPISSLSFLETNEGFVRLRIEDAPCVSIGAACRKEDEARYRSLMERFRDYIVSSPTYGTLKERGAVL